jgi:hypothetical protein
MHAAMLRSNSFVDTIPLNNPGYGPGNVMNVQGLDGNIYEVIIPPNAGAGQTIHVVLPSASPAPIVPTAVAVPVASGSASHVSASNASSTEAVPKEHTSAGRAMGAAGFAAVVGTLVIGPVAGVALAGAAVYATTRSDGVGEASRAVGEATLTTVDKAKEIGRKYGIFDKLKSAGNATAAKLAEVNAEYKITDKAAAAGSAAVAQARQLDAKYEISSTAATAVTKGITLGAKEITKLAASGSGSGAGGGGGSNGSASSAR